MVLFSRSAATASQTPPPSKSLPWYRGLWWSIWITLIATVFIYGITTALIFRFLVAPSIIAEREAIRMENEQTRQEYHQYIREQRDSYYRQLQEWREHAPPGTPVPAFDFERPARFGHGGRGPGSEMHNNEPPGIFKPWIWLGLMVIVMGAATYPIARKLTRRLEKLQRGVENFGSGNLKTRVDITGHDEVSLLAHSFNISAQHIEALVSQHKQLLAQVSHELRTPLARLRMSTELAAEQMPQIADDLRTDIKELDELVGEILLASRLDAAPDALHITSFDALALAAEEASRTNAELHGQSVEVQADEALVRRALRNLLINAERYAPDTLIELHITYEAARQGQPSQVCFSVSDRGPGVSDADRERIFEPFFRVKNAVPGGTGLGLSLVKQIALRHRGSVVCLPREGGGSRFELRIPVHPVTANYQAA